MDNQVPNINPVPAPAPAPMPTPATSPKPHSSPKSLLFHLALVVTLYTSAWEVISVLFSAINHLFPSTTLGYYYGSDSISWPVSVVIVIFPVFLALSWLGQKMYATDKDGSYNKNKKDVIYFNLFVAGIILVSCLITVIYYFIDGRDLTTAFLLKGLTLIVIAALAFGYYVSDLRDKLSSGGRKTWAVIASVVVIVSLIVGFAVIGSPRTQRQQRVDSQKITDLQNIQSQITQYWQSKGVLPANIAALKNSLSYNNIPKDPDTKADYQYSVTGVNTFDLCANFNTTPPKGYQASPYTYPLGGTDNWQYQKGNTCFHRTIDPQLYPPYNNNTYQPVPVKR